jgi:hypothetical protein
MFHKAFGIKLCKNMEPHLVSTSCGFVIFAQPSLSSLLPYMKDISRFFFWVFENTPPHKRFIQQLKDPSTNHMQTIRHLNKWPLSCTLGKVCLHRPPLILSQHRSAIALEAMTKHRQVKKNLATNEVKTQGDQVLFPWGGGGEVGFFCSQCVPMKFSLYSHKFPIASHFIPYLLP